MKGTTNSYPISFDAENIGEITQSNKHSDSSYMLSKGQSLNVRSYPQLAQVLPIRDQNMGESFQYSGEIDLVQQEQSASYMYKYNMHILCYNADVFTSINGATWITRLGTSDMGFLLCSANNRIGFVGSDSEDIFWYYSDDGINWTKQTSSLYLTHGVVAGGTNGIFCAVSGKLGDAEVYSSTDFITWIKKGNIDSPDCYACVGVNGKFYAAMYSSYNINYVTIFQCSSSNVGNWTEVPDSVANIKGGYDNIFCYVSDVTSTICMNAAQWTLSNVCYLLSENKDYHIVNTDSGIYAFAEDLTRKYSVNYGQTWTNLSNYTGDLPDTSLFAAGYGNKQLLLFYLKPSYAIGAYVYSGTVNIELPNYEVNAYIKVLPSEGGGLIFVLFFSIFTFEQKGGENKMKGNTNSQDKQFDATLVSEITQRNKSADSHFVKAEGQLINVQNYPKIGNIFPISESNLGVSFSRVAKIETSPLTAASVSGYIYAFNMHIYQNGKIFTSLDGVSFVERYSGNCRGGFGYNGSYCAVGGSSSGGVTRVFYTSDGINWEYKSFSNVENPIHITYGSGLFLLMSVDQHSFTPTYSATSPADTWIQRDPMTGEALGFATNRFIVCMYNSSSGYISVDGNNWSRVNIYNTVGSIRSINSGDGTYVGFTNNRGCLVFKGVDDELQVISSDPSDQRDEYWFVAGSNNIFVAVNDAKSAMERCISTNGAQTWSQTTNSIPSPILETSESWNLLGYGNGQLLLFAIYSPSDKIYVYSGSVYMQLPNYADDAYIRLIISEGGGHKSFIYFLFSFSHFLTNYNI